VGGIQPDDATAPAKTGDAQPVGIPPFDAAQAKLASSIPEHRHPKTG